MFPLFLKLQVVLYPRSYKGYTRGGGVEDSRYLMPREIIPGSQRGLIGIKSLLIKAK